jgi:hypothetical protein
MSSDDNHFSMTVWCTLIPPDEMQKVVKFEDDLRNVNETYEDWLVSMRGKSFVGGNTGVLLDRIRMLMINIGIACGMNRNLAEEIQSIVSSNLRRRALNHVAEMSGESADDLAIRETLSAFFAELKFTRDIFPEEEIGKVTPEKVKTKKRGRIRGGSSEKVDRSKITEKALLESSNVLKRLYMRLLSPDPWGDY